MNGYRAIRTRTSDWFAGPSELQEALAAPPCVLLESARPGRSTGRYSILADDPFMVFRYEQGHLNISGPAFEPKRFVTRDPFGALQALVRSYRVPASADLPPFATGAIGYFSYECKDYLLPRTGSRFREESVVPEMYFLFCDRAVVWDHRDRRLIFCQAEIPGIPKRPYRPLQAWESECRRAVACRKKNRRAAPELEQRSSMEIHCSMRADQYETAVRKAQQYISAGEIFQSNLTHRLSFELHLHAREAYRRLKAVNPSPFFGLLEAEDFNIVSGSPERLLRLRGPALETRPIAGTRKRGRDWKQDEALSTELLLSEKERAEHVMLVDLERNDLGRVCEFGSVHVNELMTLENYSHVKHIVSNVRGTLRVGLDAFDALGAFFPGGTITGAPKIRCMQIIDELETVARGPYTGSLGYFSFTGDMDFNILIRSLVVKDGIASLHVGAGIVADSDPTREYHETLYKAEAVLQAVFGRRNVHEFFAERGLAARVS